MFDTYRKGKIDSGEIGLICVDYFDAEIGDMVEILVDCPDGSGRRYKGKGKLISFEEA